MATIPINNMTDTWNNSGTVFTSIKMNTTNTASAAGSLLMDLQIGGGSVFNVRKDGYATVTGVGSIHIDTTQSGSYTIQNRSGELAFMNGGASDWIAIGASKLFIGSSSVTSLISFTGISAPENVGDVAIYRDDAVGILGLANGSSPTTAAGFRVYNTTDQAGNTGSAPTNYERLVADWTTTANVATIGTQAGGTGTLRKISLVGNAIQIPTTGTTSNYTIQGSAFATTGINISASGNVTIGGDGSGDTIGFGTGAILRAASSYAFGSSGIGTADAGLSRITTKVVAVGDSGNNANGWLQWAGEARVTADVTQTSTTTLANVAGLTVNVQAGRTYSFQAELSWTDAAAGGIQAAIAGTCTATNIIYDGWVIDSAANGTKGNAQATALGGAVANTTTTGTAGHLSIYGTITVNAAGTLTVQSAQNTSNATSTTIKRGSYFWVQDMP